MSTVSVIIPCYNSGLTILRAIQSIQAQTFKDVEIIVVNDGSDDAVTLKILKNVSKNIKTLNQKNKGLSSARNYGIREANSKYILPLDSDDYFSPTFIEKAIKKIENEEKTYCVFANITMFGDMEGILDRNYNFFIQLFNNQLPYAIFFEKKIWSEIGGYDEAMKLGYEDWEFNIRLGKNGFHPSKIAEPLFYYNVSSQGMMQSQSDKNYINILRYIRDKHNDTYTIFRLYKIWKAWKGYPKPFPIIFYIMMYVATKYCPGHSYNYIYKKLKFLRQSERLS
jgi:glycosyltransferase involved in cell wall biosynthesis